MSRKPIVPILLALVLALGAAVFAARWMQQRVDAARAEVGSTVPVVVATREIPFGEKVTADAVQIVPWPKDVAPANSFSEARLVVGQYTNLRLFPGDVLLKSRIVDRNVGNELSMLVPTGNRAVTVRVNDVIGVAGFLLPGNRVDVLHTRREGDRAETKTILQNRKVLAVDRTTPSAERNEPVVVRAVTLELSPEEAHTLISATNDGSIQLALRNQEDVALIEDEKKPEPVVEKKPVRTVRRAAPAPTPPKPDTITVIRQVQVNETVEQ